MTKNSILTLAEELDVDPDRIKEIIYDLAERGTKVPHDVTGDNTLLPEILADRIREWEWHLRLPDGWTIEAVSGWLPHGRDGRLIDTSGWVVYRDHVSAYGHEEDRITRSAAQGRTPEEAVRAFRAARAEGSPL